MQKAEVETVAKVTVATGYVPAVAVWRMKGLNTIAALQHIVVSVTFSICAVTYSVRTILTAALSRVLKHQL